MIALASTLNLDAALVNAARLEQDVVAAWSIAHPTCTLGDNPHVPAADRAFRAAFGTKNLATSCVGCGRCFMRVNDDLTTSCCGTDWRVDSSRRVIEKLMKP